MNRPSIHISLTDLAKILSELNIDNIDNLVNEIAKRTYNKRLSNRAAFKARVATKRKSEKIKADTEDTYITDTFNNILVNNRNKTHAKNVDIIKKTSSMYPMLQDISFMAKGFCDAFEFKNMELGMQVYIDIGLQLMNMYALNKFKYFNEKIHFSYAVSLLIERDPNKQQLINCIESYREWVNENLSFRPEVKKVEDMIKFIKLRDDIMNSGISFKDFFEAQVDNNGIIDIKWIMYDMNSAIFRAKKKYGVNKKEQDMYLNQRKQHSSYYELLDKANSLRKK